MKFFSPFYIVLPPLKNRKRNLITFLSSSPFVVEFYDSHKIFGKETCYGGKREKTVATPTPWEKRFIRLGIETS